MNDHTALDLVEHFRGTPVIVRFIEFMDVGNRNQLAARAWWCRRASSRRAFKRAGPCSPISRELPRRGGAALAFRRRRRRSRLHLLGVAALLRQPAAARAFPRKASSTPACSRPTDSICARRCAPAPTMRSCCGLIRGAWHGRTDRYSELREELRRAEPADARRSRCTTSAAESMTFSHLDADQRPTMVDVGDKAATRAHGHRRGARAVPGGGGRRRCATAACARPRVRCSIRRSSRGSWARSVPTN